jgi:hypothetical protein
MFTIEHVKNLFWVDAEQTVFECVVKYAEFNDEMPVGVNGVDQYPHIKELWQKGNAGAYGEIAAYIPPVEPAQLEQAEQPKTTGAQTL